MEDKIDSFDRLVGGLSSDDRMAILQQVKTNIDPQSETLLSNEKLDSGGISNLKEDLKNESILLKIALFFKSLFSSTPIDQVYNQYRISGLARKTDNKYPYLINPQNFRLENGFYEYIFELRQTTAFFKKGIAEYEDDAGKFLILLGSLIMPDLGGRMEKEVSPYSVPFAKEIPTDLRTSFLRKMEIILSEVSPKNKATLYSCVQCLGWFKQLVNLPYDQFLAKFTSDSNGKINCTLELAINDITQFAKILCNGKQISPETLQALYMFEAQSRINAGEKLDVQGGVSLYMKQSMDHIAAIKHFIDNVPMRAIAAIAHRSCSWMPTYKDSGEDWFVLYKAQWRKIFDKKWELWLHDRKLVKTKASVTALFKTADYPLIPNRPWEDFKGNIQCNKEYSLGFLYAFFTNLYTKHSETLKILMVDGDFIIRENRLEFTDTYSEMNHLSEKISDLNKKLSPKGMYGIAFTQDSNDLLRTIQGQAKIRSYMQSIEAEASFLIVSFGNLCRSLLSIFDGILIEKRNPKYDSISNIASLVAPDNTPIRKHLVEVSQCISSAFDLLKEVEMVELKNLSAW